MLYICSESTGQSDTMLFSSSCAPRHNTTSLAEAAKKGTLQDVWWALERGEDVSDALYHAAFWDRLGAVRLLWSAHHTAMQHRSWRQYGRFHVVCQLLLAHGVSINAMRGRTVRTAPLFVASYGNVAILHLLICCAEFDVNVRDEHGHTALQRVLQRGPGHSDMIDLLLAHGAW